MAATPPATKQAGAEATRAHLAAIVEASGDAIISLTMDGVIETWNKGAEQLYGYSAEEAVGKPALTLLARDPVEREAKLADMLAGSEPEQVEYQDVRKDGSVLDVSVTGSLIRDPHGQVVGIARIARDVTTRVEAESATREAEAQAAAGRDQALEASRMKSAFLANMSHEIRTPLNGVIGMADLLLDSPLDPEQRENARLLRGAGETLVTVVNDILDFSKIEAGALRLEYVDFDLIEAVEDACDLIAEPAREKKIELDDASRARAPGRRPRRRHSRATGGHEPAFQRDQVHKRGRDTRHAANGPLRATIAPTIYFEVADTGIGIDDSRLEKMFKPFMQADDSTTRRFGGSGLGLAIVKQLVEMMSGEVGAESVSGQGEPLLVHDGTRAGAGTHPQ